MKIKHVKDDNGHIHATVVLDREKVGVSFRHPKDQCDKRLAVKEALNNVGRAKEIPQRKISFRGHKVELWEVVLNYLYYANQQGKFNSRVINAY